MRILIVEDDSKTAMAFVRVLHARSHTCVHARTALEAVSHLERQHRGAEPPIDLLLLDVELGGVMGGSAVAKAAQRFPEIRTIILSGHSLASAQAEVEHPFSAVLAWLEKPVTAERLIREIERVARSR